MRAERAALLLILVVAAALRLPVLDRVPSGLIPDEALAGYEAHSILRTGRDSWGELLPVLPRSLARGHGLHLYLSIPGVALLGLTELAVRLPAALSGLAAVFLTHAWLKDTLGPGVALFGAALLAVSPWHVMLSRTGTEWVLLPTVLVATFALLARALAGRTRWLWPGLAAGLSLYSYTTVRALLPLLLLGILGLFAARLRAARRGLARAALVALLVAAPAGVSLLRGGAFDRLEAIRARGGAGEILRGATQRYARTFSPSFLLGRAQDGELHRLRSTGLLLAFEPGLILIGAAVALRRREPWGLFALYWCLVAPAAVVLHRDAPDPIVDVGCLPAAQALGGIGAAWLWQVLPRGRRALLAGLAMAAAAAPVARFADDLYTRFPVYSAPAWSHGAREMVAAIEARRGAYDGVLVDGREKWIFSLILFYSGYDPVVRQEEMRALGPVAQRTRVGPYRIGRLEDLLREPGRHLVWARGRDGRRLFRGRPPIAAVPLPDGTLHHLLYELEAVSP